MGIIRLVFWIGVIAVVWYFAAQYKESQIWTLMVCDGKMPNGIECEDNSYEIPGFNSAKDCLVEGASRFSRQGFECGRHCNKQNYGLNVCDEVCNQSGCSN